MNQQNHCLISCAKESILGMAFFVLILMIVIVIVVHHIQIRERRTKEELAQERYKELVMKSRIRPHFLYNCLTTISVLMEQDIPKAQKALQNFSKFLRENIDLLDTDDLIDFSKEMDHIDHYVSLEEMRYENKLRVIYDIKEYDFKVPALSIQPLVENAIKHGVADKEGIGTVLIATWKEGDGVAISIKDDGIGADVFNIDDIPKKRDEKINFGIQSSSDRLRRLCKARIDFDSRKDSGTKIIIHIP